MVATLEDHQVDVAANSIVEAASAVREARKDEAIAESCNMRRQR